MIPLDEWRASAELITLCGRRIAWWCANLDDDEKPWLVLIHGYPTSSWDWSALWPRLAADFRLVALDMLGFGLSEKPKGRVYSIAEQADLQEALLEHLGVSEAHVLAHDYGDTVGQELLARANEGILSFRLDSMAFLNGGLFPEMHRARVIQQLGLTPLGPLLGLMMSRERLRHTFDQVFGPATRASDEEIDGHWALISEANGTRVLHNLLHYIPERRASRARWVGALTETGAPLILINGGADPVSGAHLYHHFCAEVPRGKAVLLADIGHYPHTEAPDAVYEAFMKFHRETGTFK